MDKRNPNYYKYTALRSAIVVKRGHIPIDLPIGAYQIMATNDAIADNAGKIRRSIKHTHNFGF